MFPDRVPKRVPRPCFPRVCGDVPTANNTATTVTEFSPRVRGCSGVSEPLQVNDFVFPACAGMFRLHDRSGHGGMRFPRVCGDVPMN